jgi:hypothetical protein
LGIFFHAPDFKNRVLTKGVYLKENIGNSLSQIFSKDSFLFLSSVASVNYMFLLASSKMAKIQASLR